MITQTYNLDVIPGGAPVVVHVHQGDMTARAFALNLFSRNGQLDIPVGSEAYIEGIKPDGKVFSRSATLDDGTVTVDTFDQMTVLPGEVRAQCKIVNGGEILIAANFVIMVQEDFTEGADTSATDIPGLVQQAQAAAQAAQDAAAGIDSLWFVNGAKTTVVSTYNTDSKVTVGAINELKAAELSDAANISNLQGRMTTAEGNVNNLRGRMSAVESGIDTAESDIATNTADIATINSELAKRAAYVVERGADYIKYSDGTMIQWIRTTRTDLSFNAYVGSIYLSFCDWVFSQAFVDIPAVSCSEYRWGTSASWGGVGPVGYTSVQLRGYDAVARVAGTGVIISAIAIGRWK